MRRFFALLFGLALGAGLLINVSHVALAQDGTLQGDQMVKKPLLRSMMPQQGFSTAPTETVWVGYKSTSTDPNKVGVGGKWDFDTPFGTSTDSTQFWTFMQNPFASDATVYTTPATRPFWYFDYGNNINRGNHNLWKSRASLGRAFRRFGLVGVWHVDNMATVSGSSGNLPGHVGSAWCGLRPASDAGAIGGGGAAPQPDEVTGNRFTSDEQYNDFRGGGNVRSAFPGYSNLWNQLLYRDFNYASSPINLDFKYRAQLSKTITADTGGSTYFSPDPSSLSNMVINPADSFMVWVGKPKDAGVYDTNRRYLSEVLDFSAVGAGQPQKLFGVSGYEPADSVSFAQANLTIPGGQSWGSKVRVVFQVHTNRGTSDLATAVGGFNSRDGAVVLDDVVVGAVTTNFEAATDIRPRMLLSATGVETENSPNTTWISTGRPPAVYGHIHSAWDLPYDDPCGGLDGSGARQCNLANNILVQSNHDDTGHKFYRENISWAISPPIILTGLRSVAQGIPAGLGAVTTHINLQTDYYCGFDAADGSGVFFWYALRYMGSGLASLLQPVTPLVSNWSPVNALGYINDFGSPTCVTLDTDTDLAGLAPLANVDSLQIAIENQTRCGRFGATDCGNTKGSYWDNLRAGFIKGGVVAPQITTGLWMQLNDAFPTNQGGDPAPGSEGFDTTTALIKNALNNGRAAGGEGILEGDTLVMTSPWGGGTARMDMVFRVFPGPGNYSGKTHGSPPFPGGPLWNAQALRQTALWKTPSDTTQGAATAGDGTFWGSYMASNSSVGIGSVPSGHTATVWDVNTWNSAEMDSAEISNLYPIASRNIGYPTVDTWMGTYHEREVAPVGSPAMPRQSLAVPRNYCFLVNTLGPADNTNTCCSKAQCAAAPFVETWPPSSYPGAATTQNEGTKILPDGLFTPGTLIQYFARRSENVPPYTLESMLPDTTVVSYQGGVGSTDQYRFNSISVFPDMWKSERFGGTGLACILYVDGDDRRGGEPSMVGALDSMGYGRDDGSERAWRRTNSNWNNVDDPSGFVAANLGNMGLAFDKYDITASESGEGARLGCRSHGDVIPPELEPLQCKNGPSLAMLDYYYNTIIWNSGDLDNSTGTYHDGSGTGQEQSRDAQLVRQWLALAGDGHRKALWQNGDGMVQDLSTSGTADMTGLLADAGALYLQDNYYDYSGNKQASAVFKPLDADPDPGKDPFHSARRYGILNSCLNVLDIIDKDGAVGDVERSARYEQSTDRGNGGAGPYPASVYRRFDPTAGQYFSVLTDGFSFHRLRGWNGVLDPTTTSYTLTYNNHARGAWLDDALLAFGLCSRRAATIGVGEIPGMSAVNFVRGAFPNPSLAGAATVQFALAQPAKVSIRFYNVAGRLVHEAKLEGVTGTNNYRWNGVTSTGMRAASGVYFYRLSAPGIEFQNNSQRMVLLGQAGN